MPSLPAPGSACCGRGAEVATCAISGAVGTFANVDPRVEAYVAAKLGLTPEPVSTQIIPRDRHAMYFATLAVIASSLERLAVEIRHLQRTEVLEAEEYFAPAQKGSSAMPHKRNPVLSENITGLARMVRSYALPAMENVALWHERDISHSSVERMIGPDATVTLDFALHRMAGVIDKLVVYPDNMRRNLDRLGGLVQSQRVLIALTQKGVAREHAYRLVQRNAMRVWQGDGDFLTLLKADPDVSKSLSAAELEALFDLGFHTKHVDRSSPACSARARRRYQPSTRRARKMTTIEPIRAVTMDRPGIAQVEVPAGRAEDKGADEGADDAGDQIAEQATGTADEDAGQPTGDDTDHGHDDELLGVHVHVQGLPSCHGPICPLCPRAGSRSSGHGI